MRRAILAGLILAAAAGATVVPQKRILRPAANQITVEEIGTPAYDVVTAPVPVYTGIPTSVTYSAAGPKTGRGTQSDIGAYKRKAGRYVGADSTYYKGSAVIDTTAGDHAY